MKSDMQPFNENYLLSSGMVSCGTVCFGLPTCIDKILRCDIQMKAIEQYFPVVLFIMLYKMVLTFESVDEILKCDHSNESY